MTFDPSDPKTRPTIWTFSGPAGAHTHFDLKVWGNPTPQAIRNVIRHLELTATFLDEDQAEEHQ